MCGSVVCVFKRREYIAPKARKNFTLSWIFLLKIINLVLKLTYKIRQKTLAFGKLTEKTEPKPR